MRYLNLILFTVLFLLPVFSAVAEAQNLVGMKEPEIVQYVSTNMPEFVRQNGVVNDRFNYLKYETNDGMQTMLVFLNVKEVCNEVRINFDRSLLEAKKSELNEKYSKAGDNQWTEVRGKKNYAILLKDDNWYYTLSIREMTK